MQPMINIALRAVRASSEQIQFLLEREEISLSDAGKVTRLVNKINRTFYDDVSNALLRAYPKHHVAAMGVYQNEAGYSWHIMPVHNTTGLIRGLGDWCFTILCQKDGQAEHALVIAPQSGDEYTASRGRGSALNGRRLRVSALTDIKLAVIAQNLLESPQAENTFPKLQQLHEQLNRQCFMLRSSHCLPLALCQVAAGNLDAAYLNGATQAETAAALLIAREAGALTSEFNGAPNTEKSDELLCTSPKFLKTLIKSLKAEA